MPGDGVSLPTTLAQMGSVAKTQARGQQASPQVTPFSEQKDEKNELKVERVNETAEAEKNRVAADRDEKDKRKRRRLKRKRNRLAELKGESETPPEEPHTEGTEKEDMLGGLIDLRV